MRRPSGFFTANRSMALALLARLPTVESDEIPWAHRALLWLFLWNKSATLLHIPKTGGTAIGKLVARQHFEKMSFSRRPFRALQARAGAHRRCEGDAVQGTWHLTPDQLSLCGLRTSLWSPYRQGSVFCVFREPIDRFVSNYLWAARSWPVVKAWPLERCGRPRDHGPAGLENELAKIACFVEHSERMLSRWTRDRIFLEVAEDGGRAATGGAAERDRPQRQAVLSELLLHMQPQSDYIVSHTGAAACDAVFDMRVVQESGVGRPSENPNLKGFALELTEEIRHNSSIMAKLERMYRKDVQIWQRIRQRQAPTPAHQPLAALAERAQLRWPRLTSTKPSCGRPCTCSPCCRAILIQTFEDCMRCVLAHRKCGGPGTQEEESQAQGAVHLSAAQ